MGGKRQYKARDYAVGQQLLTLRTRAELRQAELAELLQVSKRTIHNWENGEAYPSEAHLRHLLALAQQRGLFTPGREQEEAEQLWALVGQYTTKRLEPFDPAWFASLPHPQSAAPVTTETLLPPAAHGRAVDWGEAQDAAEFYGRTAELATLRTWIGAEQVRLVALLGMGGIGKTSLAAQLARELAPSFEAVYWRSLRNAPPVEEWLAGAVATLSRGQAAPPEGFAPRMRLLLELLRAQRSLLILDNLETLLEPGSVALSYRAGYAGYGELLQQLAASGHQSCVVLTSREAPPELAALGGVARSFEVGGLGVDEAQALLASKRLVGTSEQWAELTTRFAGNGLVLKLVGESIRELFGGDLGSFLQEAGASSVFGGMRRLLDEQVERSSAPERQVLRMLAMEREPVRVVDMVAALGPSIGRGAVVEAVEALRRRSLIERAKTAGGAALTLQSVVLEYMTDRLVETGADEIARGQPVLLVEQPLIQALAKDYVRQTQERLIGEPILQRLRAEGGAGRAEQRLLALIEHWRGRPPKEQGYGPGNVVNLLRLLRGELRGLDLSRLAIRQAYLAEVDAQDASLVDAHLAETVLAEAFNFPGSLALSGDGALLAAGTSTGEVWLWRLADRMPLMAVRGHTGVVTGLALSADGGLVVSSGLDGAARLWEVPGGRLLLTLQGHDGGIQDVALSGDGALLASGGSDGTVKLWEVPSGRLLATLQERNGGILGVALSENGELLASGSYDGTVRLREVPSGRPLATLQGHNGGILGVALSGDGALLASSGFDGSVRLWEVPSGRPLITLQGHKAGVRTVALSEEGDLLASGSLDGAVRLWQAPFAGGDAAERWAGRRADVAHSPAVPPSGDFPLATLQGHSSGVLAVTLSGDGGLLASGSLDGTVRLWQTPSGRPLVALQGHNGGAVAVALSGDSGLLASGGLDGTARLWQAPSGRPLAALQHNGGVAAVALSGDGGLLASGSLDGTVRLWQTPSRRLLAALLGHPGAGVLGVALSGDGALLASGSLDGTVKLWEVPSGRLLASLQAHAGGVYALALSKGDRLLASGSPDGTVKLWEVPSGRLLASLQAHAGGVYALALGKGDRLLASGSLDGTVKLWEAHSGVHLRTLRHERRYERLDITGIEGLTEGQRASLMAMGAVDATSD
jgi:WD40 repeat protein/transcriptional regulator with XRE-family HTH domain